jgi:hypothetical protein
MSFIFDALSIGSTLESGKQAKRESKVAAKQEEIASVSRERDRKQQLNDALASQIATAGAGGIAAFEGSPLTIIQTDITREERATERDKFNTKLGVITIKTRGKLANEAAQTAALKKGLGLATNIGLAFAGGGAGGAGGAAGVGAGGTVGAGGGSVVGPGDI